MGNRASIDKREYKINHRIEKVNRKDYDIEKAKVKLLLLGTGESGKSTLLKQMKLLYGTKTTFTPIDLQLNIKAIRACVIANMQELVRATPKYFPLENNSKEFEKEVEKFLSIQHSLDEPKYNGKDIEFMKVLWNDSGVQSCWEEKRNLIQVQDSVPYFMSRVDEIFAKDYMPTDEDWLRVRVRTSGVVEEVFQLDGVEFNIVDVGGQRNERKKWLFCFSNVRAVIYVVALNEYDQVLFEDSGVNRMVEALDLFEKTVNDDNLGNCGWILFLNKSDLYKDKLTRSPIRYIDPVDPSRSRFTDFPGRDVTGMDPLSGVFEQGYKDGIEYFTQKFTSKIHTPSSKDVYTHVTCAMDQHNVFVVFNACRGMILKEMMSSQGFIPSGDI